jgi:hypothetical protein
MLAAIHQLHYLPWLRYLEKMARADVFVVLDDVQYTKNGFQNRNKIKHAGGWMYLTVPTKARKGQRLDRVEIAPAEAWNARHWRAVQSSYGRAPYFREHAEALESIYARAWRRLDPLNWELLCYLRSALGIETPMVRSSELGPTGESTDRLVRICQAVGADRYYSGDYAAGAYLDQAVMLASGIEVVLQDWRCPQYRQRFPEVGFIPDLSVLDLLLNEGPRSRDLILAGAAAVPAPTPAAGVPAREAGLAT